jgi:hypothetical protein
VYCTKLRLQCVYPQSNQEAKEHPENDLLSRLKRIESSLQRLESSVTGHKSLHPSESGPSPDNAHHETPLRTLSMSDLANGKLILEEGGTRYVTSSFWVDLDSEDRDGASESDYPPLDPGSIPSSSTAHLHHRRGFLFGYNPVATDLRQLHPVDARIFTLWQVFLESVDPVLKLIHVPVTQRQVIQASQNFAAIPPSFESLMFAIYYAAVTSFQCSVSCRTLLHEERQTLLDRYRFGVEQSLAKANFMSAPDIPTLQALTLYLVCARQSTDKAYVWSMTGLLVRLATKLGLHQDPASLGLSPFVSEMRRRLWWQICILDVRTAEESDMDPSICEHTFDTKLPANVNDADLDVNMTQLVAEPRRRTEMSFTLARFEISYAARKLVFSSKFCIDNGYPNLSLHEQNDLIETTLKVLDEKYFQYCDSTIPICNLVATSARIVLAKIKLTINHPIRNGSARISPECFTDLVASSIEIIEYAHTLRINEKYSKWIWLFQKYIEWDAVAFLLHSLSAAPLPTLLDKAWKVVNTFFRVWQGHIPDGERRWRRLQSLRAKAAAKQGPKQFDPCNEVGASTVTETFAGSSSEPVPITILMSGTVESHSEFAVPLNEEQGARPAIEGVNKAYIVPPITNAEHVDWNFDNVPYIMQGVASWEMDLDENAFSSWL